MAADNSTTQQDTRASLAPAEPSSAGAGSYSVFAHINASNASLYRAILEIFVAKRAQFIISLRPSEIADELQSPLTAAATDAVASANSSLPINDLNYLDKDPEIIIPALKQLHLWGNLDDTPDNAEAATIEDFYRNRRLYQLSAAGEAAEQALALFEEYLHRPGELQTTALHDIIAFLDALYPLLADQPPDDAKLHQLLTSLVNRFEQLTLRAQSFMRGLQSTVELHGISADAFLAYKERLINYLENFISELVASSGKISATLLHLETCGLADIAFPAAARHEIADALDPAPDAHAHATARWRQRWTGFRSWFISTDNTPSQSERLRSRARSAIPSLLNAVNQINDRRSSRTDRAADFAALARWFATAPDDASCHRLWRAAFALSPARHLRINNETLAQRATSDENPRASWLEATPVWLSPRLRQHGQNTPRGAARPTIDRSAEKQRLLEIARLQAAQIEHARQHLMKAGRIRLSELAPQTAPLDQHTFRLFLELIGRALTRRTNRHGPIDTESTDGTLRIQLDPIPETSATIATSAGDFHGEDHWITITPAHTATRSARQQHLARSAEIAAASASKSEI